MASQKLNILYARLSQEDDRAGDSNSVINHDVIYKRGFLPQDYIMTAAHL